MAKTSKQAEQKVLGGTKSTLHVHKRYKFRNVNLQDSTKNVFEGKVIKMEDGFYTVCCEGVSGKGNYQEFLVKSKEMNMVADLQRPDSNFYPLVDLGRQQGINFYVADFQA